MTNLFQGDSGGPLVRKNTVLGILNLFLSNPKKGNYTIFTKVSSHMEFIISAMKPSPYKEYPTYYEIPHQSGYESFAPVWPEYPQEYRQENHNGYRQICAQQNEQEYHQENHNGYRQICAQQNEQEYRQENHNGYRQICAQQNEQEYGYGRYDHQNRNGYDDVFAPNEYKPNGIENLYGLFNYK